MKNLKIILTLIFIIIFLLPATVRAQHDRWTILTSGAICWHIDERLPHADHIEMSGRRVSVVLRYGVQADSSFRLERSLVWPLLRTIPNNTHASLMQRFAFDVPAMLMVNGRSLSNEKVEAIRLNGFMEVVSRFQRAEVEMRRLLFPSTDLPMFCERYILKNISDRSLTLTVPECRMVYRTDPDKGVEGAYTLVVTLQHPGTWVLAPEEEYGFDVSIQAFSQVEQELIPEVNAELQNRSALVSLWQDHLRLETPDTVLNNAFAFAKIRAAESIYATKGGPMHGPGGESYYAAIWANDQAEYINPFFPFLGYDYGNESALNSYRHFARFMNPDYRPIPSSIIAEGIDIWNGAGDRGDAAMIAYGAARYALARGDRSEAQELWPLIEWCLEYCRRQRNASGVVESDSDELEGRFPSGSANLCTSSLYYDALISASYLGAELGIKDLADRYQDEAKVLSAAIEAYFGATVEGFETYRYYDGNDILRSWICIPLTVGIYDRAPGTITALFSPRLWTQDGLLTQAGDRTFWDRSTLYALRGVFAAGETEKALEYLAFYARQRLLGEHVPYPIEAWPEGNQRHLSAESALFCRIITEGLFGIRPTGLRTFSVTPRLPQGWDQMALRNLHAFGMVFDLEVVRKGGELEVHMLQKH